MHLSEALKTLEESSEFNEFDKNDYFLAHAFVMLDAANKNVWQIGFYNAKTDRITTFLIEDGMVDKIADQEIMKSGHEIKPLDASKVKLSVEDAMEVAEGCMKQYPEIVLKKFFIIQNLPEGTVFNVTFFTQSMNTVNVKIDTTTGHILSQNKQQLVAFGK